MTSRRSSRAVTMTIMAIMAIIIASIASCPSANSLAFDNLSSKSSSTFTSSTASRILIPYYETPTPSTASPSTSSPPSTSSSLLTMKVSGQSKRSRSSKSSSLIELNNIRLQTAGKPGSKKFMDPNKLFLGNLPYDATEDDVYNLFATQWSIPRDAVGDRIESIKIIRDWKTGNSKGYGFMQFYEPMVATSAMESVNKGNNLNKGGAWKIKGRKIRLDQGARKESEEEKLLKKKIKDKKKKQQQQQESSSSRDDLDEEGMVIHSVLQDVEGDGVSNIDDGDGEDDGLGMSEDDMITFIEKGGLKGVMPLTEETAGFLGIEGLYDDDDNDGFDEIDDFEEYYNENGYSDVDFDGVEEGDDDDDEEDKELVYDGVFEEMYNPNEYEGLSEEEEAAMKKLNREQRRAEEKKRKKRKLPFRGFGKQG
ncbi:hypothetical protein ACHAXR_002952 [Thalassiosira sp. AJA248-18]